MNHTIKYIIGFMLLTAALFAFVQQKKESSYSPVIEEPFEKVMARDKSQKDVVMKRHMALLNERYDLSKKVTNEVLMSRGKLVSFRSLR